MGKRLLVALVLCAGCGGSDASDVRSVEVALGAATSLAVTSDVAMSAMGGGNTACATVTTPCASYPCANGAVRVTLGPECPLPLGGAATGTVEVSGSWQSADDATLTSTFVNAMAGGRNVVVTSAKSLSVKRASGKVTVGYVGQNVSTAGGSALAAQSSWDVVVDTANTPDPADDGFTVDGTNQNVGGTASAQLHVSGVVISPDCRRNPVAGKAIVQEVSVTSIKQQTVAFHAACDGRADVGAGSVALDFFQQGE